jgi:deoxyribose-phosphate aldolase
MNRVKDESAESAIKGDLLDVSLDDHKTDDRLDMLSLASLIDHTLLKPDASYDQIEKICKEAVDFRFASVCVNSMHVALAARCLKGSDVKPIAVVGFPLGAMLTDAKVAETRAAIADGAQEIDMVINIGALKSLDYATVLNDIEKVVGVALTAPVKVIIETAQLTRDEKIIACALAKAGGASFVKTSTGFGGGGATVEDVNLMRAVVGPDFGVKASGGIKTLEDMKLMVAAGASRIGTSSGVQIVGVKRRAGKSSSSSSSSY